MRPRVAAFLCLLLLAGGCSLGPKEEWAEAIRDAPEAAEEARTAKVFLSTGVEAVETNIRQEPRPLVAKAEGTVDFASETAKLVGRPDAEPTIYFRELAVLLPRSEASVGTSNKPWARFDFEREPDEELDDNDRRLAVGAGLISPAVAVDLLEGVLTGSVERVGTEVRNGVETTQYRAKLAPDGAIQQIEDEDRREGIVRMHETLGAAEDVYPVDVWLDPQGRPSRIRFHLLQQKDRVNSFDLTLAYDFFEYGVTTDIALPAPSETVTSPRFRAFVEDYLRALV